MLRANDQVLSLVIPSAGAAQRILILMHDFSGGGTEHVAIRLANEWAVSGRDVQIFCGSEEGPTRALVGPGVCVDRASREMRRGLMSRLRLGRAAADHAAGFQPDVVFAPGNFHLPVLASFIHFDRSGATTIGKISNPLVRSDWTALQRALHGWQVHRLTRKIDCLVAMSPALCQNDRNLLPRQTIETCWEPIFGPTDCAPLAARQDEIPLIVAIGRLEKQKGFDLALDAMALLSRTRDARLAILGDGNQRSALQRQARRLGIDHLVSLPGYVRDVRPYLARASVFLMTSRYEGYPAALVEAIGHGVPTVATSCSSAMAEIAAFSGGGRVAASNPSAIAGALRDLLSSSRLKADPMLLARHDITRAAGAYLQLLDRVRTRRRNATVRLVALG
jgi:glycosyltransferase involved in cell wall biosynthesis